MHYRLTKALFLTKKREVTERSFSSALYSIQPSLELYHGLAYTTGYKSLRQQLGHGMSGLYYVTMASIGTCMTVSLPNMEMYTCFCCGQNPVCTSSVLSLCDRDMEYITCELP